MYTINDYAYDRQSRTQGSTQKGRLYLFPPSDRPGMPPSAEKFRDSGMGVVVVFQDFMHVFENDMIDMTCNERDGNLSMHISSILFVAA